MKTIGVRELQKKIRECVEASQIEGVVVTRNGKPASLIIGVEGTAWEDLVLQSDPVFWKLIRQRRKEKTVSREEFRRRVLGSSKKTRKKRT